MNILMSLRCGGTHVSQKNIRKTIHLMHFCLSLFRLTSKETIVLVLLGLLLFNYQDISWEIKSYNLFLSGERFAHYRWKQIMHWY